MWEISSWIDISAIATSVLCLLTFGILIFAVLNYSKFVKNVELTAKNIELTHKPIVFIKGTIIPQGESQNPMKHGFAITNTGKLPARNARIDCVLNQVAGTSIGIDNTISFPVLGKATIYPNNDLVFWIPETIHWGQPVTKAEATFSIYYTSEAFEDEASETIKFVFSKETNYNWMYVGPEVDIFKEEREQIKKRIHKLEN